MVEIKKKVTLRKKVADSADSRPPASPNVTPGNGSANQHSQGTKDTPPTSHSKNAMWIVGLAIIIIAVVLILVKRNHDGRQDANSQQADTSISNEATASQPTDTTQFAADADNEASADAPVQESKQMNNESNSSGLNTDSINEKAKQVIRGDFGNGNARKEALGDQYDVIQARVNEIYHQNDDHF